jgi:hypothetical protein
MTLPFGYLGDGTAQGVASVLHAPIEWIAVHGQPSLACPLRATRSAPFPFLSSH